ncbi:MAG: hydrogenase 4 subunit B [Candidatus Magasanikbacteria bacterium RIFOXYD2_FULL_39_9]|uniref:Hydrogenase 4 subunit B n=1 Tax=Candidatus Magasanikbacteria bacterium RIFOXYD1_FULL_40_23 TaxID=1798705 RepID=A0A1F6PAD0_9BACT|nr:MAG: hydrogenase 4 subunit B [Candidatus Magasanikbacteria bacterium RIFOXYD2_FULL_39_9]OGH93122.1 MAG: hydrogenase 4 subunit B [Candidatus Magasanikbacteria bacterium RIFOXYD1_FULL_40_23]
MLTTISSSTIFFISLLLFGIGAVGSLVLAKSDKWANVAGSVFAVSGSISGLVSSLSVLIKNSVFSFNFDLLAPLLSVSFRVDRLSAFFIFVISLIALVASIYSLGYVKHFYNKYNIGALGFFYNLFLAGMLMVVSAHNAIFFLVVWETMSLASFFLVIFENKEKSNLRAGYLYFIMTHIGTAFIIMAFLLLYRSTGSFDFTVIKNSMGEVSLLVKNLVFVLALIGFGTKAGIIPVHIWLPRAHSAAPTHVSALMSGVMIKTGIYMFIRIFMDMMTGIPVWWGVVVLVIGSVSSLLGVLYALTEHDIKRLLAYHSIENIGIILLGLGSSLVFWASDMKSLAVLGLVASLFHTLNHATFKALLFMGAGSVISQTHTRNMEEYGGLIKHMPQTAFFFLVGAMAISALPPFNGFFSEWATFQSLFYGIKSLSVSVQWVFLLGAGSLAFTGGLAAACFVKAFGAIFLARPRSEEAKHAKESAVTLRIAMAILAALTLVIGFFASYITSVLATVASSVRALGFAEPVFSSAAGAFSLKDGFATVSMPTILFSIVAALVLAWIVLKIINRQAKIKIERTWDCGTNLNGRMEITATGFSRSIITVFRGLLKPTKQTDVEYHDADMRYFAKSSAVHLGIEDIYLNNLYKPLQALVARLAAHVRKIQLGNLNVYVLYIFLTLFALLILLAF